MSRTELATSRPSYRSESFALTPAGQYCYVNEKWRQIAGLSSAEAQGEGWARAQLGALATLVILIISALGGSMFPRFLMPESIQKIGLITFNAGALEGFTKVFWREEPLWNLWPQVGVLAVSGTVFFAVARRLARRWEIV